jgi:hypothetical protein
VARAWDHLAAAEARIDAILRGLDGVTVLGAPGWESLVADAPGAASLASALDRRRSAARTSGAHRRTDARPGDPAHDAVPAVTIHPKEEASGSGTADRAVRLPASPRPPKREREPAAAPRQRALASPDPLLAAAAARRIPAAGTARAWPLTA